MYLSGFKQDRFLMIEPDSDLDIIPSDFFKNKIFSSIIWRI